MEYLQKEDIIRINFLTIRDVGGNFVPPANFLHEENLDYLIEAVQTEMFGAPLYPEIYHKAGEWLRSDYSRRSPNRLYPCGGIG